MILQRLQRYLPFLLPFAGFIVILLGMNTYQYLRLKTDLATGIVREVSESELQELRTFFTDIANTMQLVQAWGNNAVLLGDDITSINRRLFPILEYQKAINGIVIGNTLGREYYLYRDRGKWLTRTSAVQPGGTSMIYQHWSSPEDLIKTWQEVGEYDPRIRPWFKRLPTDKEVHWTSMYSFYHSGKKGITASVSWPSASGADDYTVFGLDIPLEGIRNLLARRNDTRPGVLFLVHPGGDYFFAGKNVSEEQTQILTELTEQWMTEDRTANKLVSIKSNTGRWLATFQPIVSGDRMFWLGFAAPEADLLGILNRTLLKIDIVDIFAASIGALLVLGLQLRFLKGQSGVAALPAPIVRLNTYINQGEGAGVEFKSTVRTNLSSGKRGKEIELAWLKAVVAFLNSNGGAVLLGVTDSGETCGVSVDGFDNLDKCLLHVKNLVNQHIGAEFSSFLDIIPVESEGHEVIMIECSSAIEPVFLKIGKNEEFYIRSGPSSTKLRPSQMVSFILQNKS